MEYTQFHCADCNKVFFDWAVQTAFGRMLDVLCPECGAVARLYETVKPILNKPNQSWTAFEWLVVIGAGVAFYNILKSA
jgi:phage FluMu protein Com